MVVDRYPNGNNFRMFEADLIQVTKDNSSSDQDLFSMYQVLDFNNYFDNALKTPIKGTTRYNA